MELEVYRQQGRTSRKFSKVGVRVNTLQSYFEGKMQSLFRRVDRGFEALNTELIEEVTRLRVEVRGLHKGFGVG